MVTFLTLYSFCCINYHFLLKTLSSLCDHMLAGPAEVRWFLSALFPVAFSAHPFLVIPYDFIFTFISSRSVHSVYSIFPTAVASKTFSALMTSNLLPSQELQDKHLTVFRVYSPGYLTNTWYYTSIRLHNHMHETVFINQGWVPKTYHNAWYIFAV